MDKIEKYERILKEIKNIDRNIYSKEELKEIDECTRNLEQNLSLLKAINLINEWGGKDYD